MFGWFKKKTHEEILNTTKLIKVHGMFFRIKKMDVLSYLNGSKIMLQMYNTYQLKKDIESIRNPESIKKYHEHCKDVFMSCIVEPKLKRNKDDGDGLFVDNLFTDWSLADDLYLKIFEFSYGKKKVNFLSSIFLKSE
jgi:hypothetical protein